MSADRPLTVKQAAEILGLSGREVYQLCYTHELPHYRLGVKKSAIRIDPADVLAYKERCRVQAPPPKVTRKRGKIEGDIVHLRSFIPPELQARLGVG